MPTPPKKPMKPKPKSVAKKKPEPAEDPYFAELQKRVRGQMIKNSEQGRKNYKPGQSTGRQDTDAARKAGYAK